MSAVSRCEQVCRLPGHAGGRERCEVTASWYCEGCDMELCPSHAYAHRLAKCWAAEGLRPFTWEPCGECGTRGYLAEQVDVDRENRYPCEACGGEGEVQVPVDILAEAG